MKFNSLDEKDVLLLTEAMDIYLDMLKDQRVELQNELRDVEEKISRLEVLVKAEAIAIAQKPTDRAVEVKSEKVATEQRTPTEHKPVALPLTEEGKKPTDVEKVEKVGNLTLKKEIVAEVEKNGLATVKTIFDKFNGNVSVVRIKRAMEFLREKNLNTWIVMETKNQLYGVQKKKEEKEPAEEEPKKFERKPEPLEDDDEESSWFSPTNWSDVWDRIRNRPDEVHTIESVSVLTFMPGILVKSIFRDLKGKKMIEKFEPGKFRITKGMGD